MVELLCRGCSSVGLCSLERRQGPSRAGWTGAVGEGAVAGPVVVVVMLVELGVLAPG